MPELAQGMSTKQRLSITSVHLTTHLPKEIISQHFRNHVGPCCACRNFAVRSLRQSYIHHPRQPPPLAPFASSPLVIFTASQLHGIATATVSTSSDRIEKLEPPAKEQAGDEPPQHDQHRRADHRHGDQHRPALLLVEPEPLISLRQPKQPLHDQQAEDQPGGRGTRSGGWEWGRSCQRYHFALQAWLLDHPCRGDREVWRPNGKTPVPTN